jgi:hypothetical protein
MSVGPGRSSGQLRKRRLATNSSAELQFGKIVRTPIDVELQMLTLKG